MRTLRTSQSAPSMPRVSRNAQILMNHLRPFPKSRAQRQKKQHPRYHSILPPLLRALYTSVKPGHRLIRTSNLHLSEICIAALAAFCRTFRYTKEDKLAKIHFSTEPHPRRLETCLYLLSDRRSSNYPRHPRCRLRP